MSFSGMPYFIILAAVSVQTPLTLGLSRESLQNFFVDLTEPTFAASAEKLNPRRSAPGGKHDTWHLSDDRERSRTMSLADEAAILAGRSSRMAEGTRTVPAYLCHVYTGRVDAEGEDVQIVKIASDEDGNDARRSWIAYRALPSIVQEISTIPTTTMTTTTMATTTTTTAGRILAISQRHSHRKVVQTARSGARGALTPITRTSGWADL